MVGTQYRSIAVPFQCGKRCMSFLRFELSVSLRHDRHGHRRYQETQQKKSKKKSPTTTIWRQMEHRIGMALSMPCPARGLTPPSWKEEQD